MNQFLKENNYFVIKNFITEKRARLLSSEFVHFANQQNLSGDNQVKESRSIHSFIPFVRLLVEKIPLVSSVFEEDLLPTYVYARVYQTGSDLKIHKDRDACEVSLTLNLKKDKNWPIYIKTPTGESRKVELDPGDAMMYMGCDALHWRNKFTGNEYAQVFLHYVRSYGDRSWAFFDKKRDIEEIGDESHNQKSSIKYYDEIPLTY